MLELAPGILLHVALGLGLAAVMWITGLGYITATRRGRAVVTGDALEAYAVGLIAVVAASVLLLLEPWLGTLAVPLLVAPAVLLWRRRRQIEAPLLRACLRALGALPAVVAFAVTLGLLLHGPSAERSSRASGELLFYVNKLVSASQSLVPFRDLLVEGQPIIYPEGAPTFVGAVLSHVPGFDPFLFHASTLTACMLASLALGLALLAESRAARGEAGRNAPVLAVVAAVLVSTVIVPYPTWITESPPVALAAPLAFAVYRLASEPMPEASFLVRTGIVAVGLLLTKVTALLAVAVLVVFALAPRFRARGASRRTWLYLGAGLAAMAALAIALLFATARWYLDASSLKFIPAEAARDLASQVNERDSQAAGPAFLVAGEVLLLVALWRSRSFAYAAALGASVLGSWVHGGYGLDFAIGLMAFLVALELWLRPEVLGAQRGLVLAAAACLAISAWLRDTAGFDAGFVLVTLLAGTVATVVVGDYRPRRGLAYVFAAGGVALVLALAGGGVVGLLAVLALAAAPVLLARRRTAVLAASAVVLLGAAAFGANAARRDGLGVSGPPESVSTAEYEIWERVSDVVPADGLVFTTLTGREVTPLQGWNNYPAVAGRQVYLAGWYDGRLVSRPGELERRLEWNRRVLTGAVPPHGVPLERRFGSYFAVMRTSERAPAAFERLYTNGRFALYRISA
jgi:hypothetical protein